MELIQLINKESPVDVHEVIDLSRSYDFCSYEINADVAKKAHVIIADYFHILSPNVRSSFLLRINKEIERSIIIFDESHNLDQRCRDLLSSNLSSFTIDNAIKEAIKFRFIEHIGYLEDLKSILDEITNINLTKKDESLINKDDFIKRINEFKDYQQLIEELEQLSEKVREQRKGSYIGSISEFMKSWLVEGKEFIRFIKKGTYKTGTPFTTLSIRCLDPSIILQDIIKNSHSTIFMSGTLRPIDMYQDLYGISSCMKREYKDPFPKENRLNLIVKGTTTKYDMRNDFMYKRIANKLDNLIEIIHGNTIIFFPSYELRDKISNFLNTKKKAFFENNSASREERKDTLEEFKKCKEKGSILLAVSAGSYGEGIDLIGDLLKAVIVVGLPLGKPDLETNELINYYDEKFKKGREYGYLFPAIIKCLQNAGRCIRSEEDKGIIILLEDRFRLPYYKKLLPDDMNFIISDNPEKDIKNFLSASTSKVLKV